MTREEIIEFCEMKSQAEPENEDVFNHIIKVLAKEPCGDSISRQSVSYIIKSHIHEIITESGIDKNAHTNAVLRAILNLVETMPPVTFTQKWILTSERQPKENGNYLALYRTSDGTYNFEFMMVDHCNAGGGWLHEENGRKTYKKVIAWMPLPEIYSEVEE